MARARTTNSDLPKAEIADMRGVRQEWGWGGGGKVG